MTPLFDMRTMPVRFPRNGELLTVNPDIADNATVVMVRGSWECLIVEPALVAKTKAANPGTCKDVTLFLVMSESREAFLWPIARPIPDNHAVFRAMQGWVHIYMDN